jgi:hypothetical protein
MPPHMSKVAGSMQQPPLSRKRRRDETKRWKKGNLSDTSEEEEEQMKTTKEHYDELDIPYAIRDDQNQSLQLSCILSETRKEPLRPGDVIVYPPPMRIAGYSDAPRLGQVLSTALPHTVTLDNGDVLLSENVVVRRWMEYRSQQWYPHDGMARPLGQFRIRPEAHAARNLPRLPPELRKRLERKLLPSTEPNVPSTSKQMEQNTKQKVAKDDSSRENDASDSDDSSTASSSSSSELSILLQEAMSSASKCQIMSAVVQDLDPSEQSTPPKMSSQRLSLSKQNQGSAKVPTPSAVNTRTFLPTSDDDDDDDLLRPLGWKRRTDKIPTANRPPKYPAPPRLFQGWSATISQKPRNEDHPSTNTSDDEDDILRPTRGLRTESIPPRGSEPKDSPSPPRRPKIKSFFLKSPPRASALPTRANPGVSKPSASPSRVARVVHRPTSPSGG